MTEHSLTLTEDSEDRKSIPLARGLLDYFPAALAEVAKLSEFGNRKHASGPDAEGKLVWDRTKSLDHADCILRHLADRGTIDKEGIRHSAYVAWRALAQLQQELEEAGANPGRASQWPASYETPSYTAIRELEETLKIDGLTVSETREAVEYARLKGWTGIDEIKSRSDGNVHRDPPIRTVPPHGSRIYLSGPMTGLPSHNRDAFEEATVALRDAGYEIVTPHELDAAYGYISGDSNGWDLSEDDYEKFMRWDIGSVRTCSAIAFLPGWKMSGGAGREGEEAIVWGLDLYEIPAINPPLLRPLSYVSFREQRTLERVTPQAATKALQTVIGSRTYDHDRS